MKLRALPFARAIRQLREANGLFQPEFAEKIGCSVAQLSAWENGQTQPGRMAERAIHAVADELGYSINLQDGSIKQHARRFTASAHLDHSREPDEPD